jgi:hypothetical protein
VAYVQPSRSKTGKILTDPEHRQRIEAAQSAARRRQTLATTRQIDARKALQRAAGRGGGRSGGGSSAPLGQWTAGVGNPGAAGYVSTDSARGAFMANSVHGSDINQTKDPRSGFLTFSGKDPEVHKRFVTSLKQMGFHVALAKDGSGYAVNAAGQGIRIGKPGNRVAPKPVQQKVTYNPTTGEIKRENPVTRVSTRNLSFMH